MTPPSVVFDTNVLFSAVGWGGTPLKCVDAAMAGRIEAVTCPGILNELAGHLHNKLRFTETQVVETLQRLLTFMRVVDVVGEIRGVCNDPKDDMILECAVVSGATMIVTGDRKHLLPIGRFRDVRIMRPIELVTLLETEGSTGGA